MKDRVYVDGWVFFVILFGFLEVFVYGKGRCFWYVVLYLFELVEFW